VLLRLGTKGTLVPGYRQSLLRRQMWLIGTSLTPIWHSDVFCLKGCHPIHSHSSKVRPPNPNLRFCTCKVISLFIFLFVRSFLSLCLLHYQNNVWFLNCIVFPVLIHPWLPYDVCSSIPKVVVNFHFASELTSMTINNDPFCPCWVCYQNNFFIRSQFISTNNISSYCYWCVVMVLFW
jgi:hypothetical protein